MSERPFELFAVGHEVHLSGGSPAAHPFPLVVSVFDRAGRSIGTSRASSEGGVISLDNVWQRPTTAAQRTELTLLLAHAAWKLSSRQLPVLAPSGIEGLEAEGFHRTEEGWAAAPDALFPPRPKARGMEAFYAWPHLIPWNVEPREWDALDPFLARVAPGARTLDLGCGFGKNAIVLEQRGLEIWGIDVARLAIGRCRELVDHPQRYLVASAARLPFATGSFAAVLDVGCLHCLPASLRGRCLREVSRILRPGGLYAARVFLPKNRAWLRRQRFEVSSFGMDLQALRTHLTEASLTVDREWGSGMTYVHALSR